MTDSSSEGLNARAGPLQRPYPVPRKKFRTKFTAEQGRMLEFAERLGWRIQKQDEALVEEFCAEVGVSRQLLKVRMHNNRFVSDQVARYCHPRLQSPPLDASQIWLLPARDSRLQPRLLLSTLGRHLAPNPISLPLSPLHSGDGSPASFQKRRWSSTNSKVRADLAPARRSTLLPDNRPLFWLCSDCDLASLRMPPTATCSDSRLEASFTSTPTASRPSSRGRRGSAKP